MQAAEAERAVLDQLRADRAVLVLLGENRTGRAGVLDATASCLPADGIGVVRAGNPLASPLTLDRLLIQLAGLELAMPEAEAVALALAERAGGVERLAVLADDAHTLAPDALALLLRLPEVVVPGLSQVQLVLAGRASLLDQVPALAADPASVVRLQGSPEPPESTVPAQAAPAPVLPAAPPRGRMSRRGPLALGAMAAAFAAAWFISRPVPPAMPPTTLSASPDPSLLPAPLAPAPLPPVPVPVPVPEPEAVPQPQQAPSFTAPPLRTPTPEQLRREFNAFLSRAGRDTASLTDAERTGLFQEYMAWQARVAPQ